jgi:hypothetical protein
MPKTDRKAQTNKLTPHESAYTMMPWSCNHYPTYSEIEAYVPITGNWEIIADIHDTRGVDAEIVTGLIARAVNGYVKAHEMIFQMIVALELCLACSDCLSWEAEHEAQIMLRRAGEMLGHDI